MTDKLVNTTDPYRIIFDKSCILWNYSNELTYWNESTLDRWRSCLNFTRWQAYPQLITSSILVPVTQLLFFYMHLVVLGAMSNHAWGINCGEITHLKYHPWLRSLLEVNKRVEAFWWFIGAQALHFHNSIHNWRTFGDHAGFAWVFHGMNVIHN